MSLKRGAAGALRFLGGLALLSFDLAELLDPTFTAADDADDRIRTEASSARSELLRGCPCERCRGRGALVVSGGSDVVACPTCKGVGVDPVYLMFGADFLGDDLEDDHAAG